ncbi:hypothetical protein C8Q75DRAFT_792581 [Abortiporus biennis]|nr:hypothetical protein C8Q75DRAFT_792581 [Abortiporus biennis]
MNRTSLPVEVLELICKQLPESSLPAVILSSRFLHSIALHILYRDLQPRVPGSMIQLLKVLASSPSHLDFPTPSAFVRSLNLDLTRHKLTSNFLRLLNQALRTLTSLNSLNLEFSIHENYHPISWCLDKVPFQLTFFSTSLLCDGVLSNFLETQPLIHELCLRGFQAGPPNTIFSLSPTALPSLVTFRAVHAGVSILKDVIRGRPVEQVSLSLFSEEGFLPLDALQLSLKAIKRLTIMSLDYAPPNVLLPEIASRLPDLEALHIVVLMASVDHITLLESAPLLTVFSHLKYLTFMASTLSSTSTLMSPVFINDLDIAKKWSKACPTLQTIILPKGKVWFKRDNNWTCT